MMHTTCFYSSLPLTHRPPPRSIYTDDPTYCITNPLLIQSSFNCSSCCCCCCCAANNNNNYNTSIYNSLPRIVNPSFLCNGLRQSTLIQFSPSRRLRVHGRIRQLCDSASRFSSTSESDRSSSSYYNKIDTFKARRKLGDRRYACSSFEDNNIEQSFSNDCVDEVELLLDLLTEEVGLESISVRDRKRIQKKDQQKKDSSKISSRVKTVKSGSLKRDAKVVEVRSSEKEDRKLSDERRTFLKGVDHERKKLGSSCSSYYSVSSAGEYGSDDDIVIENDDYFVKGESSNEYKDDRRVYDEELEENVERQQEFGKKESEIVKKNTAESYYGNQEWRKKSEKKLNVESSQSQHTERNSQQHSEKTDRISYQSRSGMKNENSSTQKLYSGTENKLSTSVQERTRHQKEETVDFTRQNEYQKQSNVNLEASETHNFDKRMASSSSSSSFETRMKNWEENRMKNLEESSTQVSDRFKDQREEKHQRVVQLASSKDSRKKSQQISEISDTLITNTENMSVSQTQADIRTNKQELHDQREEKHQRVDQLTSSKESRVKSQQISETSDTIVTNIDNTSISQTQSDIRTKKQELHLESSSASQVAMVAGPTETMKTGRKTTKASSFHVGMPKESSSSYKALKLNPESSFQETGTHIASADEQQKSAGQFVGEFVEKAKHQLSISEVELAREDDTQHELKSSGESGSGNYDEKDGDMGPSDEVWHESGAPDNTSSDEQAKRSGRSLWNVIGDVVRLRWGSSRSETHTPKSGGVSNQSTSSERWFSGHEPDESSRKEVSTTSSFKEKQDSPLSPLVIEESSIPLPAIRMRRSPIVKSTSVTGETVDQRVSKPLTQFPHADASGSGKTVTVEPPLNPSRRKLARTDQVSKDRFDEWEEAYTIEAKQRKNDEFFMREALSEAKKAADIWEVPVGAVLVQDGKIIARGYNLVEELRDSTAHAEMICIREASNKLHSWRLSGTTLYVTLEPCPMCAGAILQARIDTIVWGAPNKLLGADGSWIRLFPDVGGSGSGLDKPPAPVHPFHPNMIIRRGVLSSECADVMQQFFQLRRKKKDKKPEAEPEPPSPPQPSCLPIPHHHNSKLVTKLHDVFGMMFCL